MSSRRICVVVGRAGHVKPRIVRKIVQLARALEAEVELYHSAFAWQNVHKGGIGSVTSDTESQARVDQHRAELDGVVRALRRADVRAHPVITCQKPGYEGILRHVTEQPPDLLIILSSRHRLRARFLLGYTDFKLIETCPCNLLFMKTERGYCEGTVMAAVDPMHLHQKTAALDQSIVDISRRLATGFDASLHLCHAYMLPLRPGDGRISAIAQPSPSYAALCERDSALVAERLQALSERGQIRSEDVHFEYGEPADVITRCAELLSADIVTMGAVSRSAFDRLLIGHTAERVLDTLRCDVLVIRPTDQAVHAEVVSRESRREDAPVDIARLADISRGPPQ